ncbi:KaiC domain-containing protein [Haloparvum sedimenti]|uniref:KaiC domain-containing protein n=1 Tax=Haloparvum sedimenti TaxID=1678448 RepID=UPI00071E7522|nr:KaiC domain-containing protein [Haloparvum sedimenti]
MSEDDDWFERALREIEGESGAADDGTDSSESEGDTVDTANTDGSTESDGPDRDESTEDAVDDGPSNSPDETAGAEGFAGSEEPGEAFGKTGESAGDQEGAFGGSGGSPAGGGDEFGFADFGGDDGSDVGGTTPETGGGGDEFGFAEFGNGEDGGGAGGAGGGFGGGTDFNEEEFESDIERIDIGIEGLDDMILGGVPRRSLIASIGSAGTGKTTFALQFLHEALRNGDKAVYITLEESREAILSTAEEKGWPFREYEDEGLLAVVALDPIEMANSLASIRNDLSRLISEFGAERLVLDSVSLLEMMYDHPARRRSEVFDFTRSLKDAGVTTMLTSEASEENAYASRHGIVEYLTDAVFVLQYVRPSDFRETRLAVEIQKIRDANHSRETKPYEITDNGISVYQQANIF